MIKSPEQGWAWDGTASPKDFCQRDMSPKAQNPGTVSAIFVPVPSVERESVPIPVSSPGICVPGQKSHGIQVPLPIPVLLLLSHICCILSILFITNACWQISSNKLGKQTKKRLLVFGQKSLIQRCFDAFKKRLSPTPKSSYS